MKFSSLAVASSLLLCDNSLAFVAPKLQLQRNDIVLKAAEAADDLYSLLAQPKSLSSSSSSAQKKNPVTVEKVVLNDDVKHENEDEPELFKVDEPAAATSEPIDVEAIDQTSSEFFEEKKVVLVAEPVHEAIVDKRPSDSPIEKEVASAVAPVSEESDEKAETLKPAEPQQVARRRRFIPLQESTFSSTSRAQTAHEKQPRASSSSSMGTIMMKPRISPTKRDQSTRPTRKNSYFTVSDEMGRPVHPEGVAPPKPAQQQKKTYFVVKDEMGQPVTPEPLKPTNPSKNQLMPNPLVPSQAAAAASVAQSPSATTQGLFTVSGESSFGAASQEMLTVSGTPKKRVRLWTDMNDNSPPQEASNTEQDQIQENVQLPELDAETESSILSAVNDMIESQLAETAASPQPEENSIPVAAADALPIAEHSPPVAVTDVPAPAAKEPRRIRQEDLFIVTDEMGRRLNAPPTPKPKGLFEVRDEMGQLINTAPKAKPDPSSSRMAVPSKGLSKFTATQQLFKVSGETGFVSPNEIMEL